MSNHSVAEAKDQLSDLIDRALSGEGVIITRQGRPVVELRPLGQQARPVSIADLDWLAARRVATNRPSGNAGELVTRMRDIDQR